MNEHDDNNKRHPVLEAIIAGIAEECVRYLFEHAATVAKSCTELLHHLLK